MTQSDGNERSREDQELARLRFAASTAEEAARWLRSSLHRVRTGHEVEFEIQSAEQALRAALERIHGDARDGASGQGAAEGRDVD